MKLLANIEKIENAYLYINICTEKHNQKAKYMSFIDYGLASIRH